MSETQTHTVLCKKKVGDKALLSKKKPFCEELFNLYILIRTDPNYTESRILISYDLKSKIRIRNK